MVLNHTDITDILQRQIDAVAAQGGGEVVVPPGRYTFRTLRLRSFLCLTLSAGAVLKASSRKEDYAPIGYDHNEMGPVVSALYAVGERQVTVRGGGTLDLNGSAFYHMDRPTEVTTVGPQITDAHRDEAPRTYDWRVNQPVFFHRCTQVRWEGVTIIDAPCWTLSFNHCTQLQLTNLTIHNSLVIPNNDGMHFTGCRDIVIRGCHITAGDDCVAFSSITDWSVPCENIVVADCVFQSASKAISVGYMHSIVRNVLIQGVIVKNSNRAFVSMVHPGTGLVENVRVTHCVFEGRSYGGSWWGNGEAIVLMVTPHHLGAYRDPQPAERFEVGIRNVSFSHLSCRAERSLAVVATRRLIEGVRFHEVVLDLVPEQKPSLKGPVIDLAPGPENLRVPPGARGVVCRNAGVSVDGLSDGAGTPLGLEVLE